MDDSQDNNSEEMLPAERRQRLIDWFDVNFAGSSQDLADRFNISVSTIRRDLDLLAKEGYLSRTHGGAVRMRQQSTYEPSTDLARRTAVEEKNAIVAEALRHINADQSILIDTGAISHLLADAIATRTDPLTVITNDLYVAHALTYKPPVKLVVPGGSNRFGAYSLLGEPGISFLNDVKCDLYFMSAQAVDFECASDTVLELVELKRAMMQAAQKTILLADSSRFNARALYRITELSEVDMIITDHGLPTKDRDKILAHGVELVCVQV
ncbi:DeoR/GlpR family DNA-binding transcription regulator [Mariluticola halotolerans]|uniref:DeoR/GlpR family DNA-binding transcription regulator n=1 Tax=Mariluticola halotolerans TaxID=2909283 RepID=UPI0026E22268|nr:DeoR/GlpR family DNA-binding transcription regulator [Mariluticola halotolerans]UJQ95143.1 DeoR/GlpR family DNA-binding transcription regulator [Mariluticola halotolerans]